MIEKIQKAIDEGKVIIGTKETIKAIKNGKVKEVFLASNTLESVRENIEKYAKIAGIKVNILEQDNSALGALCKKPFSITVLCF